VESGCQPQAGPEVSHARAACGAATGAWSLRGAGGGGGRGRGPGRGAQGGAAPVLGRRSRHRHPVAGTHHVRSPAPEAVVQARLVLGNVLGIQHLLQRGRHEAC